MGASGSEQLNCQRTQMLKRAVTESKLEEVLIVASTQELAEELKARFRAMGGNLIKARFVGEAGKSKWQGVQKVFYDKSVLEE